MLLSVRVGGLTHPHDTRKLAPAVVHPAAFLTTIIWAPLSTPLNTVADWNVPPSILYSRPTPIGLVTVTTALPKPRSQFTVWTGAAGDAGWAFTVTGAEGTDVQPARLVTVNVQVPGVNPVTVVVVPEPLDVVAPGLRVRVQLPEGSPLNATLPVATEQVGCVIIPVTGAVGTAG